MERLEYHLLENEEKISVLYTYPSISRAEILMRFACDYFVKGKDVFERIQAEANPPVHKIYVRRSVEENGLDDRVRFGPAWEGIRIELRHFHDDWSCSPLVCRYHFHEPQAALLHLLGSLYPAKGQVWEKTSTEIDENRYVYVIYAVPILKEGEFHHEE